VVVWVPHGFDHLLLMWRQFRMAVKDVQPPLGSQLNLSAVWIIDGGDNVWL